MVHVFARRRSAIPRLALALALVGSAREAAADGVYSEISVSKAGNFSAQIPLDKPFILTGDVGETVTTVRAVFVRYKFTPWGYPRRKGHPLRTCDDVFKAVEHGGLAQHPAAGLSRFDQVFAAFEFPEPEPAEKLAADQRKTKAEAAYQALDKAGVYNVLSLATDRFAPLDKDKNKKFAIQVSDRGFFRHGASYCLLVYQERPSGESIGPELSKFAKKTLAEFERCRGAGKESCPQLAELDKGVKKILEDNGLPGELARKIAPKIANIDARLPNAKKQLDDHEISLDLPTLAFKPGERLVLDGVPVDLGAGEQSAPGAKNAPLPPPLPQDELSRARRDFATFVLKVLASNLAIHRQYAPVGGNAVESAFIVDNFVIRSVAFEKDASVLILGGVEPKQRHQISGLDKYKLPGFPALTLVDLLELARGRVILGQSSVPLRELRTENKPGQVEPLFDPKSEDADKARGELAARLKELVKLLEHVSGNSSLVGWSDTDEVYAALRPWLAAIAAPPVKEPKNDDDRQETESTPDREKEPRARKPAGAEAAARAAAEAAKKAKADELERHNVKISGLKRELNDLSQLIVDYNDAARELRELPKALDIASKQNIIEPYAQTTVADAFTFGEREWFSSYVTPTLGLAFITQAHEPFALPYVGAQLYAWPNRFDEPMWTNGRSDFRRFFGLEIGLGLSGFPNYERSFGADNQYRPLSERYSTPPVLVGLVLQPLPYISTTLGCAFMTRAPTGLTRETAEPFRSFFVSITVQLNFFNAVRTLVLDQSAAELKPALFPSSK